MDYRDTHNKRSNNCPGVAGDSLSTGQIYRGVIPFNLIIILALLICFVWRDLVLWLPRTAYG